MRVRPEELRELMIRKFTGAGMNQEHAGIMADILVWSEPLPQRGFFLFRLYFLRLLF